ncbi:MAG: antibiotic biosynthesis monooxygenase [Roseibium sp.]|uniref:antibiotic biosynthesis monooxygenase n=1 Tax=Roseibium sp. TaxID=1936156 RepID=UPI00262887F5|nr:antibiotic biosynthesis monooxygenase [Roseibium sp.]MCV0428432.1 antibiotic biosynthesis monooxygenase [Roseibium sp.]
MQQTTKTGVVVLSRDPGSFDEHAYKQWHQELVNLAKQHDGLIDVNLQRPLDGVQDQWVQIITYDTVDSLKALLSDAAFKAAVAASEETFGKPITQQIVANSKPSAVPVTVVISQLVKPGYEEAYQQWQLEIDAEAKKFPGFLGTELIKPLPGVQNEWVVIFRFTSGKHLDDWFASDIHREMLKRAEPYFDKVHIRRVGRGFEDWFANAAGEGDAGPTQFKMAMVVLLTLYPTVMLITLYISPFMSSWGLPVSMFVSNILSVIILTWAIMPMATRALDFWLDDETGSRPSITIGGGALIIALYAVSIGFFVWLSG